MSAISDNVAELAAAVKIKLVEHAERFKEQNLNDGQIAGKDKYQPHKYSRDLSNAQAFFYPPESYIAEMVSQRKMSASLHRVVNTFRRYKDCPAYVDPAYYERIELRKTENSILEGRALYVMPRLSSSDESLDENALYLQEDDSSFQRNKIDVTLGYYRLFTITVDYSKEDMLTQEFLDKNSEIIREKIVAMDEFTLEYRDICRGSRWQFVNIAHYSALEGAASLPEHFLNENRYSIVAYLYTNKLISLRTYNVNQILPNILVGEGPYKTPFSNTFDEMSNMLVDFGINTVIAIGPPCEGKEAKFYDYINDQGKDGWPFTVQIENDKEVFCYHLNSWLDKQACENLSQLEAALEMMRNASKENRFFIHCSAGLGRSGVLITILYLPQYLKENLPAEIITKLENDIELRADEKDILAKTITEGIIQLREIRPGLIKAEEQLKQAIDMGLCELKREAKLRAKAEPLFLNMRFLAPPNASESGAFAVDSTIYKLRNPG